MCSLCVGAMPTSTPMCRDRCTPASLTLPTSCNPLFACVCVCECVQAIEKLMFDLSVWRCSPELKVRGWCKLHSLSGFPRVHA